VDDLLIDLSNSIDLEGSIDRFPDLDRGIAIAEIELRSLEIRVVLVMTNDNVSNRKPSSGPHLKVIVVGAGIRGIACAVECKRDIAMYDAVKVPI
jgi:hypothetical protein